VTGVFFKEKYVFFTISTLIFSKLVGGHMDFFVYLH